MTADESIHQDRARAESFGAVAGAYDEHRPSYPAALIEKLATRPGLRVLDVGAGTGIASRQLRASGTNVLAVEPDSNMAKIARAGHLEVEVATFEDWDPAGRDFDLVTFAQSFHWVEPVSAIHKAWSVLRPGGALALMWNRFTEVDPPRDAITDVDARYMVDTVRARPSTEREQSVDTQLQDTGFIVERFEFHEERRLSQQAWLDLIFSTRVIWSWMTRRGRTPEPIWRRSSDRMASASRTTRSWCSHENLLERVSPTLNVWRARQHGESSNAPHTRNSSVPG